MGSEGATPRPWRAFIGSAVVAIMAGRSKKEIVHWRGFDESHFAKACDKANARLIVSAVNSHDANQELLEAAREVLRDHDEIGPVSFHHARDLRRAIARVEESQDGS